MCFERRDAQQAQDNGMVTLNLTTEVLPNYKGISHIFITILSLSKITSSLCNNYMSSVADEATQRGILSVF